MRTIWIIFKKELKLYFTSPIAYGLMAFTGLIWGFFFWNAVALFVNRGIESQMMGRSMPMDPQEWVIRPLLMNLSVVGLFIVPLITMRLFAEEKRSGTYELLATSPIRDWEIVLGKFLSALVLYSAVWGLSVLNILLLFAYGRPDWRPIVVGYLGVLLQGAFLLAIGTFISTTTRNQIIAAAATFGVCLLLFVFSWVSSWETAAWAKVLSYLSVSDHLDSFAKGVIDLKDVVYYLSGTFLGLFLTQRSLESLRWRA